MIDIDWNATGCHWILGYSMFRQTHMFIIHHHMIQPGRPCDCCLCQWNYLLKVCKGHLPLLKHVKTLCSCSHHELSNWKLLPSIRSFDAGRPCVPSLTMRRSYFFARDYVFVSDVFPAGLMLKGSTCNMWMFPRTKGGPEAKLSLGEKAVSKRWIATFIQVLLWTLRRL